jgi:hypothetical protein
MLQVQKIRLGAIVPDMPGKKICKKRQQCVKRMAGTVIFLRKTT